MRFGEQFDHIIYAGEDEVLAFLKSSILQIDLQNVVNYGGDGGPKKQKELWVDLVGKRLAKNNYSKKSC